MKPVIEINHLWKNYKIQKKEPYHTLRDKLAGGIAGIFQAKNKNKQNFWALQDINLKVEQGERVGIIGKNGAGKSTLLKILSRITWPTKGEAIIRGRLASLLEVGTGFHPELSGRENIYLNGSILGLKKTEIDRQFDAIVDFSGVEIFLDTAIKNYSSGMQLRLAFAVAAHLEPEILLIDEVLAVGDMEFQKKCMGKMEEVSNQHGRTILFVSHNMAAVANLCQNAVLIENGNVKSFGSATDMIQQYISDHDNHQYLSDQTKTFLPNEKGVYFSEIYTSDENGSLQRDFTLAQDIYLKIEIRNQKWNSDYTVGVGINSANGVRVMIDKKQMNKTGAGETIYCQIKIPKNVLTPGIYSLDLSIEKPGIEMLDFIKNAISFEIIKSGTSYEYLNYDYGIIGTILDWEIKQPG
jgi:homopolymeric O-antigen transport system ATP-binding protein